MAELTEQQMIRIAHSLCPWCGYDRADYGRVEIAHPLAFQHVTCGRCERHWSETYEMVTVLDLDTLEELAVPKDAYPSST